MAKLEHKFKVTKRMKLPIEFKADWLKALRSDSYNQCAEELYNSSSNGYCCLGVAGSICGLSDSHLEGHSFLNIGKLKGLKGMGKIPIILRRGSESKIIDLLANANDGGHTFEEIADWIEEYL